MGCGGYRERRFTSQDGLSLYYRDYGDPGARAVPIVCLGGLTRNSKDYHRLASRFSPGRRVICPDYRGRGLSEYDPDWRNYNPSTYVMDLHHLLAAAGLHRIVVVGTSLGGLMAMALAVSHPTALAGAVLNDIGPELSSGGLKPIIDYLRTPRTFASLAEVALYLKKYFPNLPAANETEWQSIADRTYRRAGDGSFRVDWDPDIVKPLLVAHNEGTQDLWPLFRALGDRPVLALRGELSDLLSEETFLRMGRELPNIHTVLVPGVGHPPGLEEPVSRVALDSFLSHFP